MIGGGSRRITQIIDEGKDILDSGEIFEGEARKLAVENPGISSENRPMITK